MKINQKTSVNDNTDTINYAGGMSFRMSLEKELFSRVLTSFFSEEKFYKEDENNRIQYLIKEISEYNPIYILQLAVFARNMNMRTMPIVLLVEASLLSPCKKYVRHFAPKIIKRADEITETVSYLIRKIGHIGNKKEKGSMPHALKKGIADAFNNFSEYELAKYNRDDAVKLRDVLRIVHPKPKNYEQSIIFRKLNEDKLNLPETWEVIISKNGSNKETWTEASKFMPYMATLRNLRNFLIYDVNMDNIIEKIRNEENVLKSKQFPFRFFSAYKEIKKIEKINVNRVLDAIEEAMDISVMNLPKLKGTTFIMSDNSGSMSNTISKNSEVELKEIANLMMIISERMCEKSLTGIFAEEFKIKNFSRRDGIISSMNNIISGEVGQSTYAHLGIEYLNREKIFVDRIIIFSDMQCYGGSSNDELRYYRENVNKNVKVYSVDLAGYGTTLFKDKDTCLIAGWNERILNFISLYEEGEEPIKIIKSIS